MLFESPSFTKTSVTSDTHVNEVPSPESSIITQNPLSDRVLDFDSEENQVQTYALPYYEYSGECSNEYVVTNLIVIERDSLAFCDVCNVIHDSVAGTTTLVV